MNFGVRHPDGLTTLESTTSKLMRINHLKTIAHYWDTEAAHYGQSHPEHKDAKMHPSWGVWHIPETVLSLLAGELRPDRKLVDLGCGPGHDAVGFARLGLEVLAIDISKEQLSRAIQHPRVKYVMTGAEQLPVPDESYDIAVSDHGAFNHSPAPLLLAEMRRVLKPEGVLVVCTYSPLALICYNHKTGKIGSNLLNDYPSNNVRFDGKLIASELSYAEWIKAFLQFGFVVERLEELRPDANACCYFDELIDIKWASRWPCDNAWVVRKGS